MARRGLVVLTEDGMPGGVRRAVDYLVSSWEGDTAAPPHVRLALRGDGPLASSGPAYLRSLWRLGRLLAARRVRLLHLNITQRGSTARALPLALLARTTRTPVVVHLHSSEYPAFVASLPRPALAAVRWMFRRAERVLVLGEGWAQFVAGSLRVDPGRVEVVPNAVPGPISLPGQAPGVPRVLFLGRLGERKGVGDLLRALARPELARLEWQAVLAGDGDAGGFRALAADLGIAERVRFTGWLDGEDVREELSRADILALPSRAEGLPLSLLEGLAHGLAVVATPVGAVPEVIDDGHNGLLVPPGDVSALADALRRLLCDAPLRARLGVAGHRAWQERHSTEAYGRRIVDVYEAVAPLADRPGVRSGP